MIISTKGVVTIMFITFEGGEGTGKTTQINILKKYLEERGLEVVSTREPGGVNSAEDIRSIIFKYEVDPITEALLYAAARREHLVKKVIPSLKDGKVVLCDRFLDSSIVYQGIARGVGVDVVTKINSSVVEDCQPNLTILFEIEPNVALERIKLNRTDEINRFDEEAIDFHIRVQEGYSLLKSKYPDRIYSIDASKSIEEVSKQIIRIIEEYLIEK